MGLGHAPTFAPMMSGWRRPVQDVDLGEFAIDASAAALVPPNLGTRHGVVAIAFADDRIVLAMADPGNVIAIDDVRTATGLEITPVQATLADIEAAWKRIAPPDVTGTIAAVEQEMDEHDDPLVTVSEEAPMIRLVNLLISQAVAARASDVHIEPNERDLRVRFRIDGVLHEHMRLSRALQAGVVSRVKIMCEMDIAERRMPQDGRCAITVAGDEIDLRVASLPTLHGEKLVVRLLAKSNTGMPLEALGLTDAAYRRYVDAFRRPQGLVLVTGPTGSGKTTTLYATLNELNGDDRHVITVEDPVEYALPGAYQIPINPKTGLTFASALRSILRADPDVILVGEIRDRDTARLTIEAALTGHLVLSSLHTNDAASTMSRLIEMGIEPFLVASALDCVLAQRLVRVLCERCKEPYEPTEEMLNDMGISWLNEPVTLMRAVGCARCGKTGFRGRTGIYETLVVTDEIERLVAQGSAADEVARAAERQGMRPIHGDALEKVLLGVTTIEEIVRVTGAPSVPAQPPPRAPEPAPLPTFDVGTYGAKREAPEAKVAEADVVPGRRRIWSKPKN